jgi:hypothetical protein
MTTASFGPLGLEQAPDRAQPYWKECTVVDERLRFVAQLLDGEAMMWAGDPACATVTRADAQLTRRCGIICMGPGVAVLSPLPGHPNRKHCPSGAGWKVALYRGSPVRALLAH